MDEEKEKPTYVCGVCGAATDSANLLKVNVHVKQLNNQLTKSQQEVERLRGLLTTSYDLLAEGVGDTKQYDYDARVTVLIRGAQQALGDKA